MNNTKPVPCTATGPHGGRIGFHHCSSCHHDRPVWDFYKKPGTEQPAPGGCKHCRRERSRAEYQPRGGSLRATRGRPRGTYRARTKTAGTVPLRATGGLLAGTRRQAETPS